MLPLQDLPSPNKASVTLISANSVAADTNFTAYTIPPGATMVHIIIVGSGGPGGNGVVGANSTAAGGGGGGSGSQTCVTIPACLLPKTIFFSIGYGPSAVGSAGVLSRAAVSPESLVEGTIARANGGGAGGSASGATAGTAGTAGSASTIAQGPLGGRGVGLYLAGQAGIAGGTTVAGAALSLPTTGLLVTGGTGGGGLPAAAAVGTAGGSFTVSGRFLAQQAGGSGGGSATTPGGNGSNGIFNQHGLFMSYGGTGGGSTHGSATTTGLVAGVGGAGGLGSGGGGGGGGLTGSTQGTGGKGGDGFAIVVAW